MSTSDVSTGADAVELYRVDASGTHLLASRCTTCAAVVFPQAALCPECTTRSVELVKLSSAGTVYAMTIVRVRPPDYFGPVPYGLGLVELPERLRVASVLLADDFGALHIGTPVRCTTFAVADDVDGERSYAFEPVEDPTHG